ncbi:putative capsid [uncultured virus]|uniref:Putative capsid n=1 Tax=uncultured virus TaxID=340016 RepID=A0A2K9LWC4_9VIRU|nr:putative capsid [uncultured virus]
MPFRRKRKFFSKRKFSRYARKMYKSPRSSYRDITTISTMQFVPVIPQNPPFVAHYAICASLIGKNVLKGSLNWESFTGMYAFIRPLSISVQVQLGTITTSTCFVNQGLAYYDRKARSVTEYNQGNFPTDELVAANYQALLKNFGVKLIGSSTHSAPVNYIKFKIPFINKMPIPEMQNSELWDNQFGALYVMLEGLFPFTGTPPTASYTPFGTIRIMVRSRFYNRGN